MKTIVKNLYEAMFLIDSAEAASDWDGVITLIKSILEKADAEIISLRKWDECKLAYEVKKKSRGTYILCYFKAFGEKITGIERSVKLSERIMRVLIINAEHMSQEDVEKDTPAIATEKRTAERKAAIEERELAAKAEAEKKSAEKPETPQDESTEPEPVNPTEDTAEQGDSSEEVKKPEETVEQSDVVADEQEKKEQ